MRRGSLWLGALVIGAGAAGLLALRSGTPAAPLGAGQEDADDATFFAHVAPRRAPRAPAQPRVSPPTASPNVVVIVACTTRRDQLSPYGASPRITPFLQRLADEGTVFDDPIVAAPWTRPAVTALLTGHHAVSLGMVEPEARRNDRVIPQHTPTLAQRLQHEGYYTIGVSANPNVSANFGFHRGFDAYQQGLDAAWGRKARGGRVVSAALETVAAWRAQQADQPLYLQVVLLDPHMPRPQHPQQERFSADGAPEPISNYRAFVHDLDRALDKLETGLAAHGVTPENTLWSVVTDHGEGLDWPAHHGPAHGAFVNPSVAHGAWLLRGPGIARAHRVYGVVSQVDHSPTLLSLIGSGDRAEPADGTDLSTLARGDGHTSPHRYVFTDTWFQSANRAAIWSSTHQCQRDFGSEEPMAGDARFVNGCFNRRADPLHRRPRRHPPDEQVLRRWRSAMWARYTATRPTDGHVGDELRDQLNALGYEE